MYQTYNYPQILANFRIYLYAEKLSSSTIYNYLSDTRHFITWLRTIPEDSEELITPEIIDTYIPVLAQLPDYKQIKRRLSSLKKFVTFCRNKQLILASTYTSCLAHIDSYVRKIQLNLAKNSLSGYLSLKGTVTSEQQETITELFKEVYV